MSLESSVSQQLHNTIVNIKNIYAKSFLTITHIMNNLRLSRIHSTERMKINLIHSTHSTIKWIWQTWQFTIILLNNFRTIQMIWLAFSINQIYVKNCSVYIQCKGNIVVVYINSTSHNLRIQTLPLHSQQSSSDVV